MKIACFTDIHFGKGSDDPNHNDECLKFIDWFCGQAKDRKADKIVFAGDWFDNRVRIRLDTISAAVQGMEKIRSVAPVVAIVGNHDMFHKYSRDGHSLEMFKSYGGVTVVDDPFVQDDIGYVPFMSPEETKKAFDMKASCIFGHFEIPTFLMNSVMEAPGNDHYTMDSFKGVEMVFSGHFHKRQRKTNKGGVPIQYIGSPFGHDFNDANDTERGMMFLETGGEPEFIDYGEGPLYQRFNLEQLMEILGEGDEAFKEKVRKNSVLEITGADGFDIEEIEVLKNELSDSVKDVRIKQSRKIDEEDMEVDVDLENKTLSDVVEECLKKVDGRDEGDIDNGLLVKLWREAQ